MVPTDTVLQMCECQGVIRLNESVVKILSVRCGNVGLLVAYMTR